ncbi:MAG: PhzF family phenazine biosynthesis protein [Holosporales bacterium]|nr:PhzF family phenazine biosynthesis protein [Holosporales bacterium]
MNFWIVDTFCDDVFCNNPSAVFFIDEFGDDRLLQNISMEINTTETIFVKDLQNCKFEAMCFTPNSKGLYLGNGLFAAAKVICEKYPKLKEFDIRSEERAFNVKVLHNGEITICFPTIPLRDVIKPIDLSAAFDEQTIVSVAECQNDLIVEMRDLKELFNLKPNLDALNKIDYKSFVMVAVENQTDGGYNFCAKVCAPKLGIFNGVTTPIAYAELAAYWANKINKAEFIGRAKSERINVKYNSEFTYITSNCVISTGGTTSF